MAPHADRPEPRWAVFSKPWSGEAPGPLAERLAGLGFGGAEVPVRPGAHVEPDSAGRRLPGFVETLAGHGVRVISVAADPIEPIFAACAEAGVPLIRIMAPLGDDGYRAGTERLRRTWADVQPLTERYGVRVGVQPHRGPFVESTLGVLQLIDDLAGFDLVWDAGHDALTGVDPVLTLDLAWPRLGLVNLKNGHYRPVPDAEPGTPRFRHWWGPADSGLADWSRILGHLRSRGWDRPVCLTAEYSEPSDPEGKAELVRSDLITARGHWNA